MRRFAIAAAALLLAAGAARAQDMPLSDVLIDSVLSRIQVFQDRIKREIVLPRIKWDSQAQEIEELKMMWSGSKLY